MGWFGPPGSLGKQIAKSIVEGIIGGVASTVLGTVIGLIADDPVYGLVIGVVVGMVILVAFAIKAIRIATSASPVVPESDAAASQPAPAETDSRQAQEAETVIDLGETARLFYTEGARFVPDDGSERRVIFFPRLLDHWAGPASSAVEAGRTFVARRTVFENCDIYGPAVLVLVEGSVEDTFHKCDWEEEWRAFWPATKQGRYVGVIGLENCTFRRCNFTGVAVVVKPDEYRRVYRRFTGDDPNGR